jgi:hypothetical protein
MSDGVGLSVGATNLTAVVVGRAAVTRSPVVTLYPHRPTEVGVPSENPNLNERGLIITDFVERVGDPVGIVAQDGSTHRGETLLADALRALLYAVGGGKAPADPVSVAYPAHWRPVAVDALRKALAQLPEFSRGPEPLPLVSDAEAALTALQDDPGVPTRGVIALCDFGGSGTSVTLVDAANGYQPIAPTVRHTDFSGDLIDQALLTHVITDLSSAGSVDLSSTSAIGSLSRLRGQCRGAKERLSTNTVTSLAAELPGYRGDVRLTRTELDDAIRAPLTELLGVVQETADRSGVRPGGLVAVASVGGGARIPVVTTSLSEHLRVPVITTPRPELTAAIGSGLRAARGPRDDSTAMAAAVPDRAAAALGAESAEMAGSSTFRALAWSDADDVPDVAPSDHYEYAGLEEHAAGPGGLTSARPQLEFDEHDWSAEPDAADQPWYRRPAAVLIAGALAILLLGATAVTYVLRNDSSQTPATTTSAVPPTSEAASPTVAAPPASENPAPVPQQTEAPRMRTVIQAPPPQTVTQVPAPPPAAPPPATTEPPPPTTTEAPPTTTEPPPPPTSSSPTQQPLIPTIPPIPTIPGLPPFIPQPGAAVTGG